MRPGGQSSGRHHAATSRDRPKGGSGQRPGPSTRRGGPAARSGPRGPSPGTWAAATRSPPPRRRSPSRGPVSVPQAQSDPETHDRESHDGHRDAHCEAHRVRALTTCGAPECCSTADRNRRRSAWTVDCTASNVIAGGLGEIIQRVLPGHEGRGEPGTRAGRPPHRHPRRARACSSS